MTDPERNTDQTPQADDTWELTLFVARDDDQIRLMQARLERILKEHLKSPYRLEILNILTQQQKGDAFDVIVTPTLIRVKPEPRIRLVGDLTLTEKVLHALGLIPREG